MKKIIMIIVLLSVGLVTAQSEEKNYTEDALELTKKSNDAVEASFEQVYNMIPEENLENFKKDLAPIMEKYYKDLAAIYTEVYTEEEIRNLLDFYKTDLGKALLEGQKEIAKESITMAQSMSAEIMPLVRKYQN